MLHSIRPSISQSTTSKRTRPLIPRALGSVLNAQRRTPFVRVVTSTLVPVSKSSALCVLWSNTCISVAQLLAHFFSTQMALLSAVTGWLPLSVPFSPRLVFLVVFRVTASVSVQPPQQPLGESQIISLKPLVDGRVTLTNCTFVHQSTLSWV